MQFYDFSVKSNMGKEIKLSQYKGKVVLIVNTASQCGYTPQLKGLETLYQKYKAKGFTVLAFPCNQFDNQEPFNDEEIKKLYESQYGVSYPIMAKIEVNGPKRIPLYKFLDEAIPDEKNHQIRWNFVKFIINKAGAPVYRFDSAVEPAELENKIKELL